MTEILQNATIGAAGTIATIAVFIVGHMFGRASGLKDGFAQGQMHAQVLVMRTQVDTAKSQLQSIKSGS